MKWLSGVLFRELARKRVEQAKQDKHEQVCATREEHGEQAHEKLDSPLIQSKEPQSG